MELAGSRLRAGHLLEAIPLGAKSLWSPAWIRAASLMLSTLLGPSPVGWAARLGWWGEGARELDPALPWGPASSCSRIAPGSVGTASLARSRQRCCHGW